MKPHLSIARILVLACLGAAGLRAQSVQLTNPEWNITLTDFGYSDFLLDNTPGFEGREYLSGEWGAAVGYQVVGGATVAPRFLEPNFMFPDWVTGSGFSVVTPVLQTGLNADGLPIAESVISNGQLEITLRHEMIDTVVGTPMGVAPASDGGAGAALDSSRYVMKQTCTLKNISASTLTGVQLFQFIHGLNAQRGVYDDRAHAGPLNSFRYDVTLAGVDPYAVAAGSSSSGLEDYLGFHASVAPSAFEIGPYGIEGNGADDHAVGKPSDGVHLSIENNWQDAPYSTRQGTDNFAPAQRWVSGAERWEMGTLAPGQSVSLDVVLSVRTGTKVPAGTDPSGGCNGGSGVPGGVDYRFDDVTEAGSCFGDFSKAEPAEVEVRIAEGEFEPVDFLTPGGPLQLWKVQFSGVFAGSAHLTFAYDPTVLPAGFDQEGLCVYEFTGGVWQKRPGTVDTVNHTLSLSTAVLGVFALGVDSGVTYTVSASAAPGVGGSVSGGGTYADGAGVTLVAEAAPAHVFVNWTEGGLVLTNSASVTFTLHANRTLVANFAAVGADRRITTGATPAIGGSTTGDGAYASGASATVVATPVAGYKFSKWLVDGASVSTKKSYTFTVSGDRHLVAKFKPVYTVLTSPSPEAGGEISADTTYEPGDPAVLKAKANPGYAFVNWTQNGVPVSTESNFTFTVTANRVLVANFAPGHRIDARAEPVNAGTATGGGVHPSGSTVTLVGRARPGYVFLNWTEDGEPVSSLETYAFTSVTGRSLQANFAALPVLTPSTPGPGVFRVAWPAGANGWVLQESADLSPGSWTNCLRAVSTNGTTAEVSVPAAAGSGFFRLVHP